VVWRQEEGLPWALSMLTSADLLIAPEDRGDVQRGVEDEPNRQDDEGAGD
jgi:hypothetical protein